MFANIWPAGFMMLGLGSCFALVLLVASEKLKVEIDPKVEAVQGCLPGIDCGACGFAGCGSYAKAVVADAGLIGRCAPGGADVSAQIGEILSLQVEGGGAPRRPVVHCNAHTEDRTMMGHYNGIPSCTAANAVANVQACKFGCLGFGDCVRACKFDALHVIDGLAAVDYDKCTGCTACSKACPRNLIEMVPFSEKAMVVVACNSKENGKTVRSQCKKGCIGCSMCARKSDQFTVTDFLATLNYENYDHNEDMNTAIEKCPPKVIIKRGKDV
ncbi:RnfABCDGE type electron transport complex subunit B [Planctomycetota bacterium]